MNSKAILENLFELSKKQDTLFADVFKKSKSTDDSEDSISDLLEALQSQHTHQFKKVMNNIHNQFEINKSLLPEMKELRIYDDQSYSTSHLAENLREIQRECEAHEKIISEKILCHATTLVSRTHELRKTLEDISLSKKSITTSPKFSKCARLLKSD